MFFIVGWVLKLIFMGTYSNEKLLSPLPVSPTQIACHPILYFTFKKCFNVQMFVMVKSVVTVSLSSCRVSSGEQSG